MRPPRGFLPDPVCERCGTQLTTASRFQAISATGQCHLFGQGSSALFPMGGVVACSWNCLAVLAAQRAAGDGDAVVRMVAERERQVTAEGYSPEHDASMPPGELATAGIAYAGRHCGEATSYWSGPLAADATEPPLIWPWSPEWWKPKSPARDLIRAGALIAAEADRDPALRPDVIASSSGGS